jgi:hypothetical protein
MSNSLFVSDNETNISAAWPFNISITTTSQTSPLTQTTVEIFNSTNQLILLGERFRIWDNEASSLQMIIPDIAHAKTGYTGSAWPSVYNVAKWSFDVMKDEELWVLDHGMGHGAWIVSPMVGYDEEKWKIWWWNGELIQELERVD